MTDIQDTINDLLEHPLEDVFRCRLVDRLTEERPGRERATALELVLRHKDNDGPRLLYADLAERDGDKDRAEFVRVQCELARWRCERPVYEDIYNHELYGNSPVDRVYRGSCGRCETCRRNHELAPVTAALLERNARQWAAPPLTGNTVLVGAGGILNAGFNIWFHRGFVFYLACPANDWFEHAGALCAAHPVEHVRLTTVPDIVSEYQTQNVASERGHILRIKSRCGYYRAEVERFVSDLEIVSAWPSATGYTDRLWAELGALSAPKELLAKWFPGIEFEVPPSPDIGFAEMQDQVVHHLIQQAGIPAHIANGGG